MPMRLCSYNVEHFNRLFQRGTNNLSVTADDQQRIQDLGAVLQAIDADLVGIVEAPNTTTTTPDESTVVRLQAFAQDRGLRTNQVLTGFISRGSQELAVLFDPAQVTVLHDAGGQAGDRDNPPFDGEFYFDTDGDRIKEVYEHYRPPLEVAVTENATGLQFSLMVVHTKSKGIFSSMDLAHWELENQRNRRKLMAECTWIRYRVDERLTAGGEVVVMGDVNDGPGMDHFEFQFGASAVEIILGDLFDPATVLRSHIGRPRWTERGWRPATARFKDRITEDQVNVQIDHILASQGLQVAANDPHQIWNPYENPAADAAVGQELRRASDHFPVTLDLT